MPVVTQRDAMLTLTVDGVDVACQVIDAAYQMAAPADSTPVPVACGDTVSEPGQAANGSITGNVFKDTSPTGITRVLAQAALTGAELDYTYVEEPGTSQEMSWHGKCTVPAFPITFAPDKLGRHPLNLALTTSILDPVA